MMCLQRFSCGIEIRQTFQEQSIHLLSRILTASTGTSLQDAELASVFVFSQLDQGAWKCEVVFRGETLGVANHMRKKLAKMQAASAAVEFMKRDTRFAKLFLIQPPTCGTTDPMSHLSNFFSSHSSKGRSVKLQFNCKNVETRAASRVRCQVSFDGFPLGCADADHSLEAKKKAAEASLKMLHLSLDYMVEAGLVFKI